MTYDSGVILEEDVFVGEYWSKVAVSSVVGVALVTSPNATVLPGIRATDGCVNNMVRDLYGLHWFGHESLLAINQYDDQYVRAVMLLLQVKLSPYNGFYYVLRDHLFHQGANTAARLLVDEIDAPGYGGFCLRVPRHVVCGWRAGYDWGAGDVMEFEVVGYVNPRNYVNMQYAVNVQHYLKILSISFLITMPVF